MNINNIILFCMKLYVQKKIVSIIENMTNIRGKVIFALTDNLSQLTNRYENIQ